MRWYSLEDDTRWCLLQCIAYPFSVMAIAQMCTCLGSVPATHDCSATLNCIAVGSLRACLGKLGSLSATHEL
jgi:hypothetical protein